MRITRSSVRLVLILTVILALAVPLGVVAYSHVQKANANSCGNDPLGAPFSYCQPVTADWAVKFQPLNRCVKFHLDAHIGYDFEESKYDVPFWLYPTVISPTMKADITTYDSGNCITETDADQLHFHQDWSGYDCSYNPSISISAPLGVTFGFWPTCGNRTFGQSSTDLVQEVGDWTQYNPQDAVMFGDAAGGGPCYGVTVWTQLYTEVGNEADWGRVVKVCLPDPNPNI